MGEILDFCIPKTVDKKNKPINKDHSRGTDEISHTLLLNDFGTSKGGVFFGGGWQKRWRLKRKEKNGVKSKVFFNFNKFELRYRNYYL